MAVLLQASASRKIGFATPKLHIGLSAWVCDGLLLMLKGMALSNYYPFLELRTLCHILTLAVLNALSASIGRSFRLCATVSAITACT
jgi:hypothetical protein